ncbi:MipA/OmpV family protein [Vibrio sonorensis]|uniref:MipA/OmpV family protein n=1 Tax=Vibrio sonorensis TaxID=1004316 RepID=UPI0008DAE0E0|nr:MipA/OmpV family protein [Vibrio sonorensis]
MNNFSKLASAIVIALSPIYTSAALASNYQEQEWGIAAAFRMASIPFSTDSADQSVSTFVPMLYFDNEYFFASGTEGGVYLYESEDDKWSVSGLSRMRFVDIPASSQNAIQGDTFDFGIQLKYQWRDNWSLESELMSDKSFNWHSNFRLKGDYQFEDWWLSPSATLRWKDAGFNSTYYAFSDYRPEYEKIGAGIDVNLGIEARYHVVSNLYLLGAASVTSLESSVYQTEIVVDRYQGEFYLGFGFFNDIDKPRKPALDNRAYLRVAHGWATPSNIGQILAFETEKDPYNNQLTSLFYGHPLTDELFGVPLDIYLTPGIAHHWSSQVQSSSTEFILAVKAYYTFDWPTKWRFGVAEGLSYIDSVTYIEYNELINEKEYTNTSNLLNYLDFSIDVNLGDLLSNKDLDNLWLGYSIHHRSAIFEKASQYGRIKGGSNYNTIYLQWTF